ncbi:MAG: hypothetical protein IIA91_07325, partial [Chloroflexi bacterium]|nr:hypothetical protein [Chloroflexota bacterium]
FPSDLLVAPGTPMTGIMPGPCPLVLAGLPCVAIPGTMLGLDLAGIPGTDDLDAVCWFDFNGNGLPDLPIMVGGPDDYFYSITGISASTGAFGLSGGDVLAPVGGIPAVVAAAPTIGLLPDPDGAAPPPGG